MDVDADRQTGAAQNFNGLVQFRLVADNAGFGLPYINTKSMQKRCMVQLG